MTGFGDFILKIVWVLAILIFISNLNFVLSRVGHVIAFISSGPGNLLQQPTGGASKLLIIYH